MGKGSIEDRVALLERQVKSLRRSTQRDHELLDTLATPPWKRVLFFLQGYRLWRVGRWYGKTKDLK